MAKSAERNIELVSSVPMISLPRKLLANHELSQDASNGQEHQRNAIDAAQDLHTYTHANAQAVVVCVPCQRALGFFGLFGA